MAQDDTDMDTLFEDMFGLEDDGVKIQVQPAQPIKVEGGIGKRFEAFHLHNPHVYNTIVKIALDLQKRGFQKGGMKMIFERLRWLYALHTQGDAYKLNNNFTAYYARVVMATVPRLDGFFELRTRQGEEPYVPDLIVLGFRTS